MAGTFIAGDWGTTRLRLALIRGGEILARAEGVGVSQTQDAAATFAAAIGGWGEYSAAPAVLCGMVGSTLGWVEAPYIECPVDVDAFAARLVRFETDNRAIAIAPGIACENMLGAPDVMRGEETQILGAIALWPDLDRGRQLFCLPGTHNKWAVVQDGRIERFHTTVTGELFATLCDHSLLGRDTAGLTPAIDSAFAFGLDRAFDRRRPALGHLLFEARSRRLLDGMTPGEALSFLSGLTIGADVAGMLDLLRAAGAVTVVGAPTLGEGYGAALARRGATARFVDGDAAALAGLGALAEAAGFIGE